jgi:hypothetical protein
MKRITSMLALIVVAVAARAFGASSSTAARHVVDRVRIP